MPFHRLIFATLALTLLQACTEAEDVVLVPVQPWPEGAR